MAKQFEAVKLLASNATNFSKRDAFAAINGLVEKVSDLKLKGPSFEALLAIGEAVGPQFVMNLLHKKAANHKNPKVIGAWLLGAEISNLEEQSCQSQFMTCRMVHVLSSPCLPTIIHMTRCRS